MARITFDTKDLERGIEELARKISGASRNGVNDVATEVLRLSQFEVPHDDGLLMSSGVVEPVSDDEAIVGYNKTYASYQHEGRRADGTHVIKHYQKGRKGKYLEDPIKNNLPLFRKVMGRSFQFELKFI